ncbi:MAG: tripartite tricarboxylate transporter substrate binding protein [Betaproteobacteria bacterium]|nr:tripartite tricarboxylate transporter substrate binding protein [Betaproteobacteria bacterium]
MNARVALSLLLAAACASGSAAALGQSRDFPSRPVRMIVPVPPGGSVDVVARILHHKLAEVMGQTIVVDNRPGASGNIGTELAARAVADGHTILITTLPLVVNPSLFANPHYDVMRDFAPVLLIAAAPAVLAVHPSVPAASVKELIVYSRARPGQLNYASAGSGTILHVAAELFKSLAKVNIVHVPYKGGGPALAALLGGESDLSFLSVVAVVQHVKVGRMRALGVTSSTRSTALPEVPTIAEAGVPGYEFTSWYGVLAPSATPVERVVALNGHFRNALRAPDMAGRFAAEGAEIIASSSQEFAKHLRAELVKWARVVKEGGLKVE